MAEANLGPIGPLTNTFRRAFTKQGQIEKAAEDQAKAVAAQNELLAQQKYNAQLKANQGQSPQGGALNKTYADVGRTQADTARTEEETAGSKADRATNPSNRTNSGVTTELNSRIGNTNLADKQAMDDVAKKQGYVSYQAMRDSIGDKQAQARLDVELKRAEYGYAGRTDAGGTRARALGLVQEGKVVAQGMLQNKTPSTPESSAYLKAFRAAEADPANDAAIQKLQVARDAMVDAQQKAVDTQALVGKLSAASTGDQKQVAAAHREWESYHSGVIHPEGAPPGTFDDPKIKGVIEKLGLTSPAYTKGPGAPPAAAPSAGTPAPAPASTWSNPITNPDKPLSFPTLPHGMQPTDPDAPDSIQEPVKAPAVAAPTPATPSVAGQPELPPGAVVVQPAPPARDLFAQGGIQRAAPEAPGGTDRAIGPKGVETDPLPTDAEPATAVAAADPYATDLPPNALPPIEAPAQWTPTRIASAPAPASQVPFQPQPAAQPVAAAAPVAAADDGIRLGASEAPQQNSLAQQQQIMQAQQDRAQRERSGMDAARAQTMAAILASMNRQRSHA